MGNCNGKNQKRRSNRDSRNTLNVGTRRTSKVSFKVIILGDISVGKTSLIWRFINGEFIQRHNPSIGLAYNQKVVKLRNNVKSSSNVKPRKNHTMTIIQPIGR